MVDEKGVNFKGQVDEKGVNFPSTKAPLSRREALADTGAGVYLQRKDRGALGRGFSPREPLCPSL